MAASAQLRAFLSISNQTVSGTETITKTGVFDESVSLNDSTTPDVDITHVSTIALSSGSATIDLAALVRTDQPNLDLTGNVVHGFLVKNHGANLMTFVSGATNGYGLFSATGGTRVGPGGFDMGYRADGYGTIGASADTIDVSGTAAQTFTIYLVTGPAA